MAFDENDPKHRLGSATFMQGLAAVGLDRRPHRRIDIRWAAGVSTGMRTFATELVALQPDRDLAHGDHPAGAAAASETAPIPIVFVSVPDPVGAGFVAGLARPGGNITGFTNVEYRDGGKVVGVAQRDRAARQTGGNHVRTPTWPRGWQFGPIQTAARSLGVELITIRAQRR